jgi:hypothetical protein
MAEKQGSGAHAPPKTHMAELITLPKELGLRGV